MPDIPEKHDSEDAKEIRLFGEKSIKEEAYRQKIIELEKEVMALESSLKTREEGQKQPLHAKVEPKEDMKIPEYSEGLLYEDTPSLDIKLKKYQRMLELKAKNISERISLQAQNLIEQDKIYSQITNTKRAVMVLALLVCVALAITVFNSFVFFKSDSGIGKIGQDSPAFLNGAQNIKRVLQDTGFYNNQYTIISLDYYNMMYKGVAELHFKPHSNWAFKVIADDIIENFKRLSIHRSIELKFIYEDIIYAKVNYSPVSDEIHFEFKE